MTALPPSAPTRLTSADTSSALVSRALNRCNPAVSTGRFSIA
jgi:hypothetical protein